MDMMIAGGAAIDPQILQFFRDLGIMAPQGYGLTECAPMAALNQDLEPRNDSVGHVLPGMEVMIADKDEDGIGEICLKGPNVMLGYYHMPEETAKVIVDGWFHTGDLGYTDGPYIYITGRKRMSSLPRTARMYSPEELEYYLGKSTLVSESMVWASTGRGRTGRCDRSDHQAGYGGSGSGARQGSGTGSEEGGSTLMEHGG